MNIPELNNADEREQRESVNEGATMGERGESKIDGGEGEISRGAWEKREKREIAWGRER